MAVIRIKRSAGTSAPGSLKTAEIAYAMGTGTQANAGDRLFFGKGDDGSGNASSIVVIGGEYFTNMLDHAHGTLTASSALIVDADSKLDNLKVDNIDINGNTISSTDTNGNVIISPNGSGTVDVATSKITSVVDPTSNQDAATKKYVDDQFGGAATIFFLDADAGSTDTVLGSQTITFSGDDWLTTTVTDNTITITHDTSGVTAGTYGSATQIPVFTVDDRGHIDSAGTVAVATDLTVGGDAGSNQTISLLTDTLNIAGGTNIHTVASGGDTVTVHMDSDVAGLSSLTVDNLRLDGNAITSTDTNGNITITPNGSGEVVASTLTVSDLTDNRLVLAGTSGALEDDANLTFNGTELNVGLGNFTVQQASGNVSAAGTLNIDGEATLASAVIEDLTDNRILIAGTGGAVEDDTNLTFDGTTFNVGSGSFTVAQASGNTLVGGTLNVTGDVAINTNKFTVAATSGNTVIAGTLDVNGQATLASVNVEDLTSGRIVLAGTSGELGDNAALTFNGTQLDVGTGNFTVQQASGNVYTAGTLEVDGEATLASAIIEDLTDNRILVAGTGGAVEDDGNLTWDGSALGVTGDITHVGIQTTTGQLNVDNIRIDGNTISSTDGSNVMYIDPAPTDSDGGDLIIRGNLFVQGVQTVVNSTTVSVNDLNLVLADSAASAAAADGAGLTIGGDLYSGTKATLTFNGANDEWEMNKTLNMTGSTSLEFGGVDWKEVLEDHLVNNTLVEGEGLDITYDDNANTITFAAEIATVSNRGVASFNDSDFTVTSGNVRIDTVDGGTF